MVIKKGDNRIVTIYEDAGYVEKVGIRNDLHNQHELAVWNAGQFIWELFPFLPERLTLNNGVLRMPYYPEKDYMAQGKAGGEVFRALQSRWPKLKRNTTHQHNVGFRPDGTIVLFDLAGLYPWVEGEKKLNDEFIFDGVLEIE